MERRNFLKTIGVMCGSALTAGKLKAEESESESEFYGILIDTTRCVGCRTCEVSCSEANNLPEPDYDADVFDQQRKTSENHWTIIKGFETENGTEIYVKNQCMHCNQPACAAACPTKAMLKTKNGPVIWQADKCMGCRFCMLSCPFDVPKFEYNSPIPKIQKCIMCYERLKENKIPACVENCPEEALMFGKRRYLIEEANRRIYNNPDRYVHHIYGDNEVGGTGVLYLASVPFEQLKFRTELDKIPYPELTKDFLYGVPIVLTLWPAFLLALNKATKNKDELMESEG